VLSLQVGIHDDWVQIIKKAKLIARDTRETSLVESDNASRYSVKTMAFTKDSCQKPKGAV
jgi:hypothetical protein